MQTIDSKQLNTVIFNIFIDHAILREKYNFAETNFDEGNDSLLEFQLRAVIKLKQ